MYSKSQTVSPKPVFLTALPSSISAPSLLLLQKPTGAGSHRKQRQNSNSNKNKPQNVEQKERKNSNNKNSSQKRKHSNNKNNNGNNSISTNNIVIKCEEFSKEDETTNFFNKLAITNQQHKPQLSQQQPPFQQQQSSKSISSSSAPQTISGDKKETEKIEQLGESGAASSINSTSSNISQNDSKSNCSPEEEIESSFEEKNSNNEQEGCEVVLEILPISIDEETLKHYTSFLSVLSEIIVNMCQDIDSNSPQLDVLSPSSTLPSSKTTSSLTTIEKFQVFNVDQVPEISIQAYIQRVFKYLPFGTDIFIISTIYLDRLIQNNHELAITPLNIHRLFMGSIIVASKFHNDKALNNRYYAQVGGISLSEMNQLEIHFLLLLNWKLNIDAEIFNAFKNSIQSKIDILDQKIRKLTLEKEKEKEKEEKEKEILNNDEQCNSNNQNKQLNNAQPTQPKRYVTIVETDTNNSSTNNSNKNYTPKNNKFNNKNSQSTSQFSRIINNNRNSSKISYHHPNYLTYPLAPNHFPQQQQQQQQQQQHIQPQQSHYYAQPQYYNQQQQYYSHYQYNQQLSYYQQYQEYYQQQQHNSQNYLFDYSSSYDDGSTLSSSPSTSPVLSSSSTSTASSSLSSSQSYQASAAPQQPHSWQNAYYYNYHASSYQ
ncbi:hypothetical protein DICPUDRAFT_99601 [Dictyostelium purpureum]|uniref:Cyclin-like domain-containing protein n=1 Tax=Dictyostelium purpureum TaxID=5786 RepID=F1A0Q6_DICPU|nr:uncharacterized protein DICPUDRAFT_99601 [Dictyostelium purpureum]EGC30214.1 hypothetical protein DICPUDRAFT_99601 [Dictyostelium purpureum]|eukprot:XP_003293250.1 hypothetical protein DICPUDRAFT_99601 [Dictyostelium purpureum]